MKKNLIFIIVVALFIIVVIIGGIISVVVFKGKVNIKTEDALLRYSHHGITIEQPLSKEESQLIKSIFNSKKTYIDNPSCGFSAGISVSFDDKIFCIACDRCPTIKYLNSNKYFKISEEQRNEIEKIFNKYGGTFPCV